MSDGGDTSVADPTATDRSAQPAEPAVPDLPAEPAVPDLPAEPAVPTAARPSPLRPGACVWLTGLSGSGKSTSADALVALLEARGRVVTVLDGDVVRTHLTKGLGFSREDRDTNVRRVGYVAAEVVRHGGLVVAALVSPYREARDEVRGMVGAGFIEVFVDTPLDVVEARDVKGWYAKARSGEVSDFTGISDPYEPPLRPEIVLQTTATTAVANARLVAAYLEAQGFLEPA